MKVRDVIKMVEADGWYLVVTRERMGNYVPLPHRY